MRIISFRSDLKLISKYYTKIAVWWELKLLMSPYKDNVHRTE